MNGNKYQRTVQFAPVIVIAALLLGRRYQLELGHFLSMAYLFWDYVLVGAIAFFLGIAIFYRRLRMATLFIAILVFVDFVSPTLQDWHRNATKAQGPTLKVISFNWLGEERDRSNIYAWLAAENADIVALQEIAIQQQGVTTTLFEMFPYHTKPVSDVMILSKYPIIKQASKTLDTNSMVRAELDVQNRRLVVWNIHPATLKELAEVKARDHYLADVAEHVRLETEPVLMMGDFNATRWDPGFRAIVAAGALHEQPSLIAIPTRMAVRKGLPFFGSPIDHVLTNEGNVLSDCQAGPNLGSDHKPLICKLTLRE